VDRYVWAITRTAVRAYVLVLTVYSLYASQPSCPGLMIIVCASAFVRAHAGAATGDCWAFLIQGMAVEDNDSGYRTTAAWQYVFIACCVVKAFALAWLCMRAFAPFQKIVVNNK